MLIKAAINGGRTRTEHSAVPISPDEQAADVRACLKAGAGAIHLHVRSTSSDGSPGSEKESLTAADVARTLLAMRSACHETQIDASQSLIGVSTGAWISPHPERLHAVAAWKVLPDFASVNFGEEGSVKLAELLLSRGVEVEAGLCDAAATTILLESGLVSRCVRVLIEPQEQAMPTALETVRAIEKVLSASPNRVPAVLLHGTESTVWPMMDEAIKCGYDVRVGLEDTLFLPDGSVASNNAELIAEAVRRVKTANFDQQ